MLFEDEVEVLDRGMFSVGGVVLFCKSVKSTVLGCWARHLGESGN